MKSTMGSRRGVRLLERLESRTMLSVSGVPLRIGGDGFDIGKRVVLTSDGGYIAAGLFSGKVDFDPGAGTVNLTAQADTDIYIAKYSSTGALEWARRIGGDTYSDQINDQKVIDIAADPRFAGGQFVNGVGSDPRLAAEYINDLSITADGGVLVAGAFIGQVDFNPGAGTRIFRTFDNDYYDAFVLKLNAAGNLAWADQLGGRFTDLANAVEEDGSGNIFVTGLFSRDVDFVPGNPAFTLHALGRSDAFLMKLSAKGRVRWVKGFGGDAVDAPLRDVGTDLALDSAGNPFIVGSFAGNVDFDPGAGVTQFQTKRTGGYLAGFDNRGNFRTVAVFTGKGYDALTSVAVDSADNVIISGYFQGEEFDVNPGPGTQLLIATPESAGRSPQFSDVFVAKLDNNLNLQWARQLAGTGNEMADRLAVDSADNIILSGSFYATAQFGAGGPVLASTAGVDDNFRDRNDGDREDSYDAFLWQISSTGSTNWAVDFGEAGDDFGAGIAIGSDDSILMTGRYRGTTDFDPGPGLHRLRGLGVSDAFVTQFAQDGTGLYS